MSKPGVKVALVNKLRYVLCSQIVLVPIVCVVVSVSQCQIELIFVATEFITFSHASKFIFNKKIAFNSCVSY